MKGVYSRLTVFLSCSDDEIQFENLEDLLSPISDVSQVASAAAASASAVRSAPEGVWGGVQGPGDVPGLLSVWSGSARTSF